MITVVNGFKHGTFECPNTVYIGRPGKGLKGSPLANPEPLKNESDRAAGIQRYRRWLFEKLKDQDSKQLAELHRIKSLEEELGTVYLACFCAPKPCHGDIVKAAIECGRYC